MPVAGREYGTPFRWQRHGQRGQELMKSKSSAILAGIMLVLGWQVEAQTNDTIWSKSRVVQQGDMRIEVEITSDVHFWPFDPDRAASYRDGFYIIKLANLSNTKKIDFTTWRGKSSSVGRDYATLTDDNGNTYKQVSANFSQYGQSWNEESIYPQKNAADFLRFEQPVSNFKWLHLELPAENFGGSGMIRFEIPNPNNSSQSAGSSVQAKENAASKSFKQGDIEVKINDVVHGFTTGESATEHGKIVKTSNFLLISVSLYNKSSDTIYDYKTFRSGSALTDDNGNKYTQTAGRISSEIGPHGEQVYLWCPPYPLNDKFYPSLGRINPKTGRDDVVAFNVPNSPGTNLNLELPAANYGGTGKIKFEIPVSTIKNWQ